MQATIERRRADARSFLRGILGLAAADLLEAGEHGFDVEVLARLLRLPDSSVNVKAKTGEGLGEIGRGELIAARCVALIEMI